MEVDDTALSKATGDDNETQSVFGSLAEDEDESHLPPGVRRQNRCNSSSSEDESEKKPQGSDFHSSDSGSDTEHKKKRKISQTDKSSKSPEHKTKSSDTSKKKEGTPEVSKKDRDSSRSRSRSASPSHKKRRRRSSDRSRGSRSRSRSRSPDRRHKRDRKRRHRSRSHDRKRSRDRDHHKRRKDRKRSRSRERRRRSRDRRSSRDRKGSRRSKERSRSRSRDRGRRHRSRSRSRTPEGSKIIKFGDKVIKAGASFGRPLTNSTSSSSASSSSTSNSGKPLTFKEKMRQQFIKAMEEGADVSSALTDTDGKVLCTQTAGTQQTRLMPAPTKPPVPLMASLIPATTATIPTSTITATEAAMQSMLQLQKETTAKTGVEIPSYYNPGAINPVKYAEQVQKRKLLWSKNKDKDVNSQWHATTLTGEHDDKSKEKFRKLMGIKNDSGEGDEMEEEKEIKQRQIFDQLDKEYQFARMATHTHRGIGLGFGSANYQPPVSSAAVPTSHAPPPPTTGT